MVLGTVPSEKYLIRLNPIKSNMFLFLLGGGCWDFDLFVQVFGSVISNLICNLDLTPSCDDVRVWEDLKG